MIDIIIPAYNCMSTLDRTLGSLISQTNNNFSVIIVDDFSTENISSIIENYTDKLDIHYLRNEKNIGCGMSRQVGIDFSKNEYITFLDADDVFMPYTVEVFEKNIKEFPNSNVFNSYFYHMGENSQIYLMENALTWCHGRLYKKNFLDKYNIRNDNLIKYCDDSYFNSIVDELNPNATKTITIPMMMWIYNKNSTTHKKNYKEDCVSDFIYGMRKSIEFVLKYKNIEQIEFISGTLLYLSKLLNENINTLSNEEKKRIKDELLALKSILSDTVYEKSFDNMFNFNLFV